MPNPGSGLDAVRLGNAHWLLIYNDTTSGRQSLAVSLSDDEGKSWKWTRHLEKQSGGSFHYPAVIQGRDGTVHAVYSYFVAGGKSMKHAAFNEAWVRAADSKRSRQAMHRRRNRGWRRRETSDVECRFVGAFDRVTWQPTWARLVS